jgi:hypothetical protein
LAKRLMLSLVAFSRLDVEKIRNEMFIYRSIKIALEQQLFFTPFKSEEWDVVEQVGGD